jgi:putative CocE/NonD family hydrolase
MSATFNDLELAGGAQPPANRPSLRSTVRIPMPDGVELVGDLYAPGGTGPWPIIVERTCYGAAALGPLGDCYAAHGYLFLAVDVRGRFRSEGEWDPLAHEKADGPAVLRWAAALADCDGRVGTRGHSYSGVNQLLAAPHAGACLKAMVCYGAPADAFDNVPFQGGAYELSDLEWAWTQTGPTGQPRDDDHPEQVDNRFREALAARPFIDADIRLGLRTPYIREWMRHWRLDRYWRERSFLPDLNGHHIPTLHISGWWDNNGRGSVLAYRALGGAAGGQRLLIGPWEHLLAAPPLDDLPEYERAHVARAALRDAFTDELAWFEQHLRGYSSRLAGVELFVTGAWRWIEANRWPPHEDEPTAWYLAADGGMSTRKPTRDQREYRFDPASPNPVKSENFPVEPAPYNTADDAREDVLVYRSEPLTEDLLALGDVRVIVEGATTAQDVDWVARLVDEYPDGRAICLRDGILRGRFRNGFARPRLITPNNPATYEIDLWHVGHLFRAGHRVRVEICSSALGRWDVNPGDGGDLATSTTLVPSTQTIYHGGRRGSRLLLPVCPAQRAAELL